MFGRSPGVVTVVTVGFLLNFPFLTEGNMSAADKNFLYAFALICLSFVPFLVVLGVASHFSSRKRDRENQTHQQPLAVTATLPQTRSRRKKLRRSQEAIWRRKRRQ